MKRYLVRRLEIDGQVTSLALVTDHGDGTADAGPWNGTECHSTRMVDATVTVDSISGTVNVAGEADSDFVDAVRTFLKCRSFR